ncbi:hypothetical protein V1264_015003 [Littorina saxatilis]|uniref:Uncharacterized protein n=1 Tax=Littorina saxatilis TaxID=31220 RepID=A0AAN9GHJ7_9CAEN
MQTHISFIIKTGFFHLRRIASIRRYLTHDACVKLVVSLIFSRLDYCNSLLAGLPASSIHGLQQVQNAAARLTLRKTKRDHITPLLRFLHWLPVNTRISYKLSTLVYKCLNDSAPEYLQSSLDLYTQPSDRPLCSAADPLRLHIPRSKLAACIPLPSAGPSVWNSLPLELRQSHSLDAFKSRLKTQFFP